MFSLNYIPRRPKRNSKIHIKSPADITSTGVIFILGKGVSDILASGVNSTWSKGSSEPGFSTLKEYLSWQLSIYAELFEAENPGLKVEGLACNWLKADADAFWVIERKPSELVQELLKTTYFFSDNGPVYFHPDLSMFGIGSTLPAEVKEQTPIVAPDVVDYFTRLLKTYKDAEAKLEEAKTALRAAMTEHKVKSFDFGTFSATIGADSVSTSFDTKTFKKDHPELYKKYASSKAKKGSFTIKLKDND